MVSVGCRPALSVGPYMSFYQAVSHFFMIPASCTMLRQSLCTGGQQGKECYWCVCVWVFVVLSRPSCMQLMAWHTQTHKYVTCCDTNSRYHELHFMVSGSICPVLWKIGFGRPSISQFMKTFTYKYGHCIVLNLFCGLGIVYTRSQMQDCDNLQIWRVWVTGWNMLVNGVKFLWRGR